ncbi:hypothetical protein HH214_02600 [Mucilaginibacter robiniae]|uniref:Peptidoglycan domain protein n=1 Tax=Mucilaginibacter robiniae TaxID=2728022 RepID=A0A7L5DZY8_9SPHI|nr:glycosyl hydrolase 108 family protein [Mucilaginibacter robiniae]QJD94844.1 hypothetical protein HH214_02600 [Mucilaginibacter robiniae]
MSQFNVAFQITMRNEGGYANTPEDAGGETYKGIARNYWPSWAGWPIVDGVKAKHPAKLNTALASSTGLQTLVMSFYKSNFWDAMFMDAMHDQQLANQLFDTAVNMGIGTAAKILQKAINQLRPGTLVIDGQAGPKTIAAANAIDAEVLYKAVCELRKQKYEAIIQANPSQVKFSRSWFSRIVPYQHLS